MSSGDKNLIWIDEVIDFKMPKVKSNVFLVAGIAAFVLCIFLFLMDRCTVKTITVEGNVHYSNDEIVSMVRENWRKVAEKNGLSKSSIEYMISNIFFTINY